MDRLTKLRSEDIRRDTSRERVKAREDSGHCLYCVGAGPLSPEHLLPRSMRGPQDEKNAARDQPALPT